MKKTTVFFTFAFVLLLSIYGAITNSRFGRKWEKDLSNNEDNSTGKTEASITIPDIYKFHVIFDQSNEQVYSPFDTSFTGMSRLAIRIRKLGGSVSINTQPLQDFLPELKNKNTILVLGVAMYREYHDSAITAIKNYLNNGGNIFLMVEHDNLLGNGEFQNKLLKNFGIKALPISSSTKDTSQKNRFWPFCEAKDLHLDKVKPFLPAPLISQDNIGSFLKITDPQNKNHETVAVKSHIGKGTLIVLGDAELAWNGFELMGIDVADNGKFIDKTFSMLAKTGEINQTIKTSGVPIPIYKSRKTKGSILIESKGFSFLPLVPGYNKILSKFAENNYNIDLGGKNKIEYDKYDLVIVINPLSANELSDDIFQARKVMAIGDGQADYLQTQEIKNLLEKISGNPVLAPQYPLNKLLAEKKIQFAPATLVTQKISQFTHFQVPAKMGNTTLNLDRATTIATDSAEYIPIAKSTGKSWPSTNITPKQVGRKPVTPYIPTPETVFDNYPVIVKSKKIFAISDITLISDADIESDSGKKLLSEIFKWLEN